MANLSDTEKIKKWEPLVHLIANKLRKKLKKTILEYEDLISVGMMAILDGYKNYDPTKGAKLKSYLYDCVYFALQDTITHNTHLNKSQNDTLMAINKIYKQLGKDASDDKVIKQYKKNNPAEKYPKLHANNIDFFKNMFKLAHYEISNLRGCDSNLPSTFKVTKNRILLKKIIKDINDLPKQESQVLKLRWFENKSHKEVGNILGFSIQKSSLIETRYRKLFAERYSIHEQLGD